MSERKLKLIKNKQPQVGRTNKVNKRPYRKPDLTGYSFKDGDQVTQISSTQPEVDPLSAEMPEQEPEISNPSAEFDDPQHLHNAQAQVSAIRNPKSEITPAEATEVARFKALTAARAAQQAMIERIMAELDDLDAIPPAA